MMELDLPSSKPSRSSCSRYGSSGSSSWYCSANSSTGSPSITPASTAHTNKHTIKKRKKDFVVELESGEVKNKGRKNISRRYLDSICWNNVGNGVVEFRDNWRIFGPCNDRLTRCLGAK